MQQTTISKPPRVEVVDALRGFAVLAILLVHHVEHFIYPVYPDPATLPGWLNVLNEGVFTVVFGLFAGKSYSIFALLFGFTFYIQTKYLQPIITQYFIDNKSEIWLLFLIAHSKR